ncbi:alkaline phosphatase [Actinobacteria bacterium YIM 96077]|uniref:Alkaline phosphatase n=1 Tax=Phytoactinopolyspora halophila TaxID=1981511 RepID=A0A329QIF7_9ACTN|nr:alkaline phosphatase D family protein [Phytoactinopolyspora halophila]AYY13100.1 alkaline phosphatase [Actinobacteria bacterium YIM 96077]RAW11112.1 alkaline phosphatase [Phytoactinopolyspora halophila]
MSSYRRRPIDRRNFLALAGGGTLAVASAVAGFSAAPAWANPRFGENPFSLGVASGDPLPDGVVLWTRLAPDPLAPDGRGGMPDRTISVQWQVAEDPKFRHVVRSGVHRATPELGHSVHVEVSGLRADRQYWYRFRAGPELSEVGRTRTAPEPGAALSSLAFAFASCQNYPQGYYTALRHMSEEDLDLVIHLGDYIYEGTAQGSIGRGHLPATECFSLADYRVRYGQYKSDVDLRACHAAFPWMVIMDDHDVDNNWAADLDGHDNGGAEFLDRRAAAFQAYYEHMPLRQAALPAGPDMQLYRRLVFGDLAQFDMVDTRQYRDNQACGDGRKFDCDERLDPSRTMLGDAQESWLLDGLGNATATWKVLANQIFMMQGDSAYGPEQAFGMDTWDGYAAARQRLFDGVRDRGVENFVVVTGDAHRSVAANLKVDFDDPDSDIVGTEFLGTSISSGGDGQDMDAWGRRWLDENPHMKFHNVQRGYARCELTPNEWRTDYRVVPYVSEPGAPISTRASVYVEAGQPGIQHVEE